MGIIFLLFSLVGYLNYLLCFQIPDLLGYHSDNFLFKEIGKTTVFDWLRAFWFAIFSFALLIQAAKMADKISFVTNPRESLKWW